MRKKRKPEPQIRARTKYPFTAIINGLSYTVTRWRIYPTERST